MGLNEQVHQQPVKRLRIRSDLLVAITGRRGRCGQLQSIQRARSGQRIPSVTVSLAVFTREIPFTNQQRQHAVRAQPIVIVEICITQPQTVDALRHQRVDTVFDTVRITVIGEAAGESTEHAQPLIHLPQQQSATVGRDPATIEPTDHLTAIQCVKFQLLGITLCRHRPLPLRVITCCLHSLYAPDRGLFPLHR
ncbi:MAG: hypothetical protein R3E82_20340 [Pseudomonadales bacterium]